MDLTISDFIKNKQALIVEDESSIAQLLKIHLVQMGFNVDVFHDAESAYLQLQQRNYDLCLLDWMLPGVQGVDFLKKIRRQFRSLKVLMITAKSDSESIVSGLESGADDFLTKPFEANVLVARIRQLMRRKKFEQELAENKILNTPETEQKFVIDDLFLDFSKYKVTLQNNEIHLTLSEFKLLEALIKARGSVLTREQLINLIQGEDVSVTARTIDTHIFSLRKKIGIWSKHIETVRGVGYRILISTFDASEKDL